MTLPPYTFGVGDRFGHEAVAQLAALQAIESTTKIVHPVWNKSHREHALIGSTPAAVRLAADRAVAEAGWTHPYFVDADHVGSHTVEAFLASCDFFTLDVADHINTPSTSAAMDAFVESMTPWFGDLTIPGLDAPLQLSGDNARAAAAKFLAACQEAGRICRQIENRKGSDCVIEVSMDETDAPQSPVELFYILAMLAAERIPLQTIAPKFYGRFNKGVDYDGDLHQFTAGFDAALGVVAHAIAAFDLPSTLKLSVHSGSDKFTLYPVIRHLVNKWKTGLHLKTAGTTWLEEVIGLAESGGEGLAIAKTLYRQALAEFDALALPYSTVIDVQPDRLPPANTVDEWDAATFAATLRHDPACPLYRSDFRQLMHIAFKLAARMGDRFTSGLTTCRTTIERNVTYNLLERHLRPLFG